MNPIIQLRDVWKVHKMGEVDVYALRGASLDIEEGEFVVILGPSGSGKSTIMNLVGCLDIPTRGSIFLQGNDIRKFKESELAQIRGQTIGFVFQQFHLIPTLTALQNVMLPMEFQDIDTRIAKEEARKMLHMVGLEERMYHKPNELSGGQMQRVAIARALAVDPDIILADEPTGNLDTKTGAFIIDFLISIHKEKGKTIVIVTHDSGLVKFAEKVIYLKDGKIEKITRRKEK